VLSVKQMIQSSFLKSILVLVAVLYWPANIADSSQSLQLAQTSEGFNAEQKYMASCFACHSTGAAGAPKVGAGMISEWEPRLEKGFDTVVQNVINGMNTMPAKGLCFDCTDADLRAIVEYMLAASE